MGVPGLPPPAFRPPEAARVHRKVGPRYAPTGGHFLRMAEAYAAGASPACGGGHGPAPGDWPGYGSGGWPSDPSRGGTPEAFAAGTHPRRCRHAYECGPGHVCRHKRGHGSPRVCQRGTPGPAADAWRPEGGYGADASPEYGADAWPGNGAGAWPPTLAHSGPPVIPSSGALRAAQKSSDGRGPLYVHWA
jgi:hypothetical protein